MSDPIKYRIKPLTNEEQEAVVADYNAEMPIAEIMTKHGISKMTLYRTLKRTIEAQEGGVENGEERNEEENGESGSGDN